MEDTLRLINRWLKYQRYMKEIPSLSVSIIDKVQVILHKNYPESQENRLYRIASISKLITAISIMQLVEKNKISLKDKISDFLPIFNTPKLRGITIFHLLTHTSGLKRDADSDHWETEIFPCYEELIQMLSADPVVEKPGKRGSYSNFGYAVLGLIIESITKKTYEQYVKENILIPLQMKNTYFDLNDQIKIKVLNGYSRKLPNEPRKVFIKPATKSFAAATGFISSVSDLAKLMISLLNDTKLISQKSKDQIFKKYWKISPEFSYGLGCEIFQRGKMSFFGHTGGFAGYKTAFMMDIKNKRGAIVLGNAIDSPSPALALGILSTMRELPERKANQEEEKYEGVYRSKWGDLQIASTSLGLLGLWPSSLTPITDEIFTLNKQKLGKYVIKGRKSIDYEGEEVFFSKDAKGRHIIHLGPNQWTLIPGS